MSERFDGSERAIVDALRTEAKSAGAPAAARERVASRLSARVGVPGLVAAATMGAGSASAAAVSSGTATTGAVAASTLSFVGLSKLFLLGMAFGASTGLGLHFVGQRGTTPVAPPVAGGASALVTTPKPAPFPAAAPNAVVPSALESDAKPRASRPAAPGREMKPAVDPTPELPVESAPTKVETLAAQQALLDEARVALRRGDGEQALRALDAHRARFVRTAFEEERGVLEIRAALLVGKVDAALEQARSFAKGHPNSVLLPSLKTELEKAGLSGFETDPAREPQSPGVGKDKP